MGFLQQNGNYFMNPVLPSDHGQSRLRLFNRRWFRTAMATFLVIVILRLLGWGNAVVEIEMQSNAGADGEIFYTKAGQDYQPYRHAEFAINSDGHWHTYRIEIPERRSPDRVRVDPGSASGAIGIRRLTVKLPGNTRELVGKQLVAAIENINLMHLGAAAGADTHFVVTAPDPYVDFKLPGAGGFPLAGWLGAAALAAALWLLLVELMWSRLAGRLASRVKLPEPLGVLMQTLRGPSILLAPSTVAMVWAVAASLKLGCSSNVCMSERSLGYGALLTVAMLALAVVGAAIVSAINKNRTARSALFLWALVGQVCLMAYIYLRSLIAGIFPFPITRIEVLLIVGLSLTYLSMRSNIFAKMFESPSAVRWILVQVSTLAAISIWIADRELPRLVMLSSDPEIHAFFARQVERIGAVPRMAEGWGVGVFHYPAGSAVLTYVWTLLSGLDVRNVLAASPLLQCLLGALVVVEMGSTFTSDLTGKFLLLVTVLGITFAGFLFPLYVQYSYMQGTARQESGAIFALFTVVLLAHGRLGLASEWVAAFLLAIAVFCLGVLNPVNLMVPCALSGAFVFYEICMRKRLSPMALVPVIGVLLLLLDPYYSSLFFGKPSAGVEKVALVKSLKYMSLREILAAWSVWTRTESDFFQQFLKFSISDNFSSFIAMFVPLGVLLIPLANRIKSLLTGFLFALPLIAILWIMFGMFAALRGDARYYLLAPYFEFSLTQNKAVLLTLMSGLVVALVHAKSNQLIKTISVAAIAFLVVAGVMRSVQQLRFEPRFAYCGSMGCPAVSDLEVIRHFREDAKFISSSLGARILVPNQVIIMGPEKWLFPVGGARLLAQETDFPLAFYYYEGDNDYTTSNYELHVCKSFDRAWLRSEHIRYVFLPADRAAACVASMETLPWTEHVVASSGNSYLLELR